MATKKTDTKKQAVSTLQQHRGKFNPVLPEILKKGPAALKAKTGKPTKSVADQAKVKKIFPHTYGMPEVSFVKGNNAAACKKAINAAVVLSGGQAPGGHNVIAGLLDGFKKANSKNKLFGFLGGPSGVIEGKFIEITPALMANYRNTGGFDLIQSGRTKIETDEQELEHLFTGNSFNEDYRILNREIRALGYNIPPLVNAYMSLSPTMKLFGTAINYGFGDVEETGILIAIDEIWDQKRVRHIDSFIKEHPEALKITSGANNLIYKEK